ncbi:hypothetical protein As57867_007121, partial [Aphanomyces stellatus]
LLIDLVNLLLSTTRNGSMDVTTPDLIVHMSYGQSPGVPLTFQPAYARQVLSTELNTLDRAIRDLRTSTHPFSIFAQYCSLDFQRRWDLAFYYEIGPFESIDMFLVAVSEPIDGLGHSLSINCVGKRLDPTRISRHV